ncbi:MAG: NUDIX domain-containing protein [Anaerolineae bacterium]|jgi:8-oxo-dGTP pyrophosphatase MutT (NUDIX family)|nr:NUDIX domain-containing protein [Anaerolineae bacterium]
MTTHTKSKLSLGLRQRIANALKRVPWIIAIGHFVWRLFQPKYTIGVAGVIFNEHGQVLLVEHVLHPLTPWGLPGGWINPNEQPYRGLERELLEELQLTSRVESVLLTEISYRYHLDIAYLCQAQLPIGELSSELLSYGWFAPDQLPKLILFHQQSIAKAVEMRANDGHHHRRNVTS